MMKAAFVPVKYLFDNSFTEKDNLPGGFTLIEIMVVLLIIAVLSGIVAVRYDLFTTTETLRKDSASLKSTLLAAQMKAINKSANYGVKIDVLNGQYYMFPDDVLNEPQQQAEADKRTKGKKKAVKSEKRKAKKEKKLSKTKKGKKAKKKKKNKKKANMVSDSLIPIYSLESTNSFVSTDFIDDIVMFNSFGELTEECLPEGQTEGDIILTNDVGSTTRINILLTTGRIKEYLR